MQLPSSIQRQKRDFVDVLEINNKHAKATISLFGGHLLSFAPHHDGRDRLWVSESAIFDNKTPIRGGIPVCWPWFSDAHNQDRNDLPSHGFVRNQNWQLKAVEENSDGTRVVLSPENAQGPGWANHCDLTITFDIGSYLTVNLETRNAGKRPVSLNCALHSYFSVNNIDNVSLEGLTGIYRDKTKNWQEFETPSPYTIHAETDRIHLSALPEINIVDQHQTRINSEGHDSIVVWNPGSENSKKMKDMADDGYKTMVCVETAVTQTKILQPNESIKMTQVVS